MQTLRLPLVGMVTIALLAGVTAATVAQTDEAATTSPVVVSGTLECLESTTSGDGEPMGQSVATVYAWQADDTRLTGEASYGGHWQLYEQPIAEVGNASSDAAVVEIVNEGGGWLCEASRTAEPRTGSDAHTLVFTGEDGYEGLTAYLHVDWSTTPFTFSGVILPGEAPEYAPPAQ